MTVLVGDDNDNTLVGGSGIDTLIGKGGDDTLKGGGGNDALLGGNGSDRMLGGLGNDLYVVDDEGGSLDQVIEFANQGVDTVESYRFSYTLPDHVENLTQLEGAEWGWGNALNNVIIGNAGDNWIRGMAGADTMIGGQGNDAYEVDNYFDVVTEEAGGGIDRVGSYITFGLSTHLEHLFLHGTANIDGYGNSKDNDLYGNEGINVIFGNDGADYINGRGGADTFYGGLGDDEYYVTWSGEQIVEYAGEGLDEVTSLATYTMPAHVEILRLNYTAGTIHATGNAQQNWIYGNEGDNNIDGKAGADFMAGDFGNDTYQVDQSGDVIEEFAPQGYDTVHAAVSYGLSDHVEDLFLIGAAIEGTGNDQANKIYGNAEDNILEGQGGIDAMYGSFGDDSYYVDLFDDQVVESAGAGTDIVYSSANFQLPADVEALVLTGATNINAVGNAGANVITGNTGNNAIDGAGGGDTLTGGGGNDIFLFAPGQAQGDIIIDFLGNGDAAGDMLQFTGFGPGAIATYVDSTQWQIAYNGGASVEVITFLNGGAGAVHPSDIIYA